MIRFSKPKTPGYGISKDYYLTVLAATAQLPSIFSIVNPKAAAGAIEGFGVPLARDSNAEALGLPLQRGAYAIATKDRKTLVRCLVVSKEEAGFDPEALVDTKLSETLGNEKLARIRGAWSLVQLSFETFDAAVDPSVDFVMRVASKIASLTDGVAADPIAQKYFLPEELARRTGVLARDLDFHVSIVTTPIGDIQTLGRQKFALLELVLSNLDPDRESDAGAFLLSLTARNFSGTVNKLGDLVGAKAKPFRTAPLGDTAWSLEPVSGTAGEALKAWKSENVG